MSRFSRAKRESTSEDKAAEARVLDHYITSFDAGPDDAKSFVRASGSAAKPGEAYTTRSSSVASPPIHIAPLLQSLKKHTHA